MSINSRPEKPMNPDSSEVRFEPSFEEFDRTPRVDWAGQLLRLAALIVLVVAAIAVSRHFQLIEEHLTREAERDIEHSFWMISRKGTQPGDRTAAFKRLVAAGNSEWRIANLRHLELEGVDLSQLEFKEARFESCNFKKADLRSSNFHKCGFEMCNLSKANLRLTDCSESEMFKVDLSNANLEFVKLRKANLSQSTIHNANLQHSDLSEATFEMADLTGSNLADADMNETDLRNVKFARTNLTATIMPKRFLSYGGADFTDSNWWRARGLPITIVARCRKKFIPTKNAPKGFYEDYQLWLKTNGKSSSTP